MLTKNAVKNFQSELRKNREKLKSHIKVDTPEKDKRFIRMLLVYLDRIEDLAEEYLNGTTS